MSNSWSQATGVFQIYSDALAGLGQHLTEPVWLSLMAELRGCGENRRYRRRYLRHCGA